MGTGKACGYQVSDIVISAAGFQFVKYLCRLFVILAHVVSGTVAHQFSAGSVYLEDASRIHFGTVLFQLIDDVDGAVEVRYCGHRGIEHREYAAAVDVCIKQRRHIVTILEFGDLGVVLVKGLFQVCIGRTHEPSWMHPYKTANGLGKSL